MPNDTEEITVSQSQTEPEMTDAVPEDGTLANGFKQIREIDGKSKTFILPLRMGQILAWMREQTDDWPRRIGNVPFIHDEVHGIAFFESPAALFGWLQTRVGRVSWHGGPAFVKQGELFAECQRTSTAYVTVENLPHEPAFPEFYYACEDIEPGNGCHLNWLLDRFNPETPADRDLIQAAFATPLWGGPPSCRPAFVITSDDGRGSGKTKVAEMIGELYGGVLQFSANEDIGTIKTRLLTPGALTRRVALLDNVKSHRFSWADLEAMITASSINGHRMYFGDGTRPNTLTWLITLNGASLSTDMAQRSIIIKIKKTNGSATWEEETRAYIREHQHEILGDIITMLRSDPFPLAQFKRWSSWERDILQRVPEPGEAQKVIGERQEVVDADGEEASTIEDYFADQLRRLEYSTDRDRVFIPAATAARWYGWATNQSTVGTTSASRALKQLATEGRFQHVGLAGRSYGRGFVWAGKDSLGSHMSIDLQDRLRDKQSGTN